MKFVMQMNKKKLIESLIEKKIKLKREEYIDFQKFLFNLGFSWKGLNLGIDYNYHPFMYLYKEMTITIGTTNEWFRNKELDEIFYKDYESYINENYEI